MTIVWQNRFLYLIAALLVTVCSLAACSLFPPAKVQPIGTPAQAISTSPKPTLQLQPCRLGSTQAQCGTLKVYENRAARSGRMIDLRVAVIKASGDQPAPDPIFYLAGGPGSAATEDAARGQQFPYSLSENHDLVFVDQRGTGGSNRVILPSEGPDLSGLSPEQMDARLKEWIANYLAEIDMDPRFYTTSVAMDDLDEVREALGYDQINLAGFSYGATAAQYYLRQHEEHVRSVFLFGGSLLDIPVFELWAYNGQRTIDILFDLCQTDPACQSAFPELREEFSALFIRLAEQPVTETLTGSSDAETISVTFTADLFAAVIRGMTKDAMNDPRLPLLIHRAYQDNDFKEFARFFAANGFEWWGDQMMERVIRCGEKWAAFDPEEVAKRSEGSYLKGWDVSLAQSQAASCVYTPRGEMPEGMDLQTGSQAPVLIINSDLDPIDPPDNMAGAQVLWPNSLSLVMPYHGHSLSDREGIRCLWAIEDEFIQSGSVDGLHTDCLESFALPAFWVPAAPIRVTPTGAAVPTLALAENPGPIFNTSVGELAIEEVRWVEEVNGVMPGPDEKLLLIVLSKPGQPRLNPNNFSLKAFDQAMHDQSNMEVHIGGEEGT